MTDTRLLTKQELANLLLTLFGRIDAMLAPIDNAGRVAFGAGDHEAQAMFESVYWDLHSARKDVVRAIAKVYGEKK